jgi:hypothetical protein
MLDFVIWSFAIALTPTALLLASTLFSCASDWIGRLFSWGFERFEQRGPGPRFNTDPPSVCIAMDSRRSSRTRGRADAVTRQ